MRFIPLLCLAATTSAAHATVLFSDNFNSYDNGNLPGQGPWVDAGTTGNASQPLIGVLNGAAQIQRVNGYDVNASFTSPLPDFSSVQDSLDPAQFTYYAAATVDFTAAGTGGRYFLATNSGGSYHGRVLARADANGNLNFGVGVVSDIVWDTTARTFGEEYRVVVRYDVINGANNDIATLYIFPLSAAVPSVEPAIASAMSGSPASEGSGLLNVHLRQDGSNAAAGSIDDVVVATTFAEAAAIPEPTSLAAIGLAAGLLGRRRLRR